MSEGWSVLAAGTVQAITTTEDIDEVRALRIEPWAGGKRRIYFPTLSLTSLAEYRRIVMKTLLNLDPV